MARFKVPRRSVVRPILPCPHALMTIREEYRAEATYRDRELPTQLSEATDDDLGKISITRQFMITASESADRRRTRTRRRDTRDLMRKITSSVREKKKVICGRRVALTYKVKSLCQNCIVRLRLSYCIRSLEIE